MGEQLRTMFSYSNMYGYRRNVPRLRSTPSTFTADPKWGTRLNKTFKNHYSPQQISDHFRNSYIIGFPFHENDYKEFHPSKRVKSS